MRTDGDSKTRTVAAARYLFATQGFHQTAMSELAAEAKVSVGQIYRLFKAKNDIIQAIVDEDAQTKLIEIRAISDAARAGTITIEVAFEKLVRRALSHEYEALTFEIMAEAHRNPLVADSIASLCSRYRPALRDLACVANDRLSEDDGEAAEELLLACLFGLGHRTLSRPSLDIETTALKASQMLINSLRSMA